jgi:hypothetical protein
VIVEAIDRWRRADAALARASSPGERGAVMLERLRARGAIERLSEIEYKIEDRPRRRRG